jgi:signal transduction histidine kinase
MSVLVVIEGPDRGKVFPLDRDVVHIGRDPSNLVCLADPQVSRQHAQIVRRGEGLQVIDLESRNGTFLNGTQIGAARVAPGDILHVGRTSLAFAESPDQVRLPQPGATPVRIVTDLGQMDATIHARQESRSVETEAIDRKAAEAAGLGRETDLVAFRNLRVLYRIASLASTVHELDVLLDRVLEIVFGVLPAERAFIVLIDPASGVLVPRAVRTRGENNDEVTISRTIVTYCVKNEEGVLTTNAQSDERFESGKSVASLGIRSAICVPLRSRRQVLGVLGVDARASTTTFTPADLHLMTAIGNQVGLVVENTQLVQENIRAERLAAVGEAAASLSHYVKNILQGLQGGSTLIETGLEDDDAALIRRGWQIVEKSQRKVAKLVKDMLTYAGAGEPNRRPTDLTALLNEVIDFALTTESAGGVDVERDLAPDLPQVSLDPDAVTNGVLNLLLNAFEAVAQREAPRVTVSARLAPDGQHVEIAIADNGVGIPAWRLPSIFNALTSTKGGRGTGLGLAVARKIVAEHGGEIAASSQEGRGSTFTIRLPLHPPLKRPASA